MRIQLAWLCSNCIIHWTKNGSPKTTVYLPSWMCVQCYDRLKRVNKNNN